MKWMGDSEMKSEAKSETVDADVAQMSLNEAVDDYHLNYHRL